MSDRVAVFNDGRIQQLAPPEELYERPPNRFVAQFIGENNTLKGVVETIEDGVCTVRLPRASCSTRRRSTSAGRRGTTVSIRPERVEYKPENPAGVHTLEAEVLEFIYMGDIFRTRMRVAGNDDFVMKCRNSPGQRRLAPGERIAVGWLARDCRALERLKTGDRPDDDLRTQGASMNEDEPRSDLALLAAASPPRRGGDHRGVLGRRLHVSQVEAYHKPFTAETGIKINSVDADNPATPIKAMVEAGNVTIDVATSSTPTPCASATRACWRLDRRARPHAPTARRRPRTSSRAALYDCLVSTDVYSTIFAYDSDQVRRQGADDHRRLLRPRELPRQARHAQGRQGHPRDGADGRRRPAGEVYDDAGDAGGHRARLRQARHDQGRGGLVGGRRAAAAAARRRRGRDDHRLQRPHLQRGDRRGQAVRDRLGRPGLRARGLRDPEGRAEPRGRRWSSSSSPPAPSRSPTSRMDQLRSAPQVLGAAGRHVPGRQDGDGAEPADLRANLRNALTSSRVLGRPRHRAERALQRLARRAEADRGGGAVRRRPAFAEDAHGRYPGSRTADR